MSTATRPRQFTPAERAKLFPLSYDVKRTGSGEATIAVRPGWEHQNLVRIGPFDGAKQLVFSPRVNILAAPVFNAFLFAVERDPLSSVETFNDIITYDGGFVARLKRGVTLPEVGSPASAYDKLLSNHSRGTAIDLNAKWNPMGKPPAALGQPGSLVRVAEIARSIRVKQDDGSHWGLVWGGDWKGNSIDGMHFEVGVWP